MIGSSTDKESDEMAPMLVRLYDTHKIYALAKDKSSPARSELACIVLDMFHADLSPQESEMVTDVLIGLIRQAEQDLRKALAERLSESDKVPLRLILHLANDDIYVAEEVLKNSPVLGDLDLMYIIKSQGPEYWQAIALRRILSDQVINLLIDLEEPVTSQNLAGNLNIKLTDHAMKMLVKLARDKKSIAQSLLKRDDVPKEIAMSLYEAVGEELKSYIVNRFSVNENEINNAIGSSVEGLISRDDINKHLPSEGVVVSAMLDRDKGVLNSQLMIGSLRKGDVSAFIAQFSVWSDVSTKTVIDMLVQRNGQGFAIACRALNVEKADFMTMFFLTQRVRSLNRVASKYDVSQAMASYDKVTPEAAAYLLEVFRSQK